MAFIGLRSPVYALVGTETSGSAVTYKSGAVAGRAISANVSWDRNDEKMYADDVAVESDNTISGGTITFESDCITDTVRAAMLGLTAGTSNTYIETDAEAPYVGFGYIRVKRYKGVRSYVAYWIYKVQFGSEGDDAATKEQNVTFQGETLTGNIFGVVQDSTGLAQFREHFEATTEAAALTWLKSKAGIS